MALLDGCGELTTEVAAAPGDARRYLGEEARHLLGTPRLLDGLARAMRPDAASQEHVDDVICPRCTTSPINHSGHDQPRPRTLARAVAHAPRTPARSS